MDKQAANKYAQVLADVPGTLRSLASERDFFKEKCAGFERREAATKVASAMHAKGINLDQEHTALVADLEKEAELGRLGRIHDAVEMVAPNMGVKLAHVSDERQAAGGSTDFERFIMGDVG